MKKIIALLILVILFTGCSLKNINDDDINSDKVATEETCNASDFSKCQVKLDGKKLTYYVETDDHILMDFVMDCQHWLGIYNKRKRTSEIAEIDMYFNDKYRFTFGKIKGMDQSAIYSAVRYEGVYDMWLGHTERLNLEKLYPNQVRNLRKLFPKLKEEGNPFVAIYSLK